MFVWRELGEDLRRDQKRSSCCHRPISWRLVLLFWINYCSHLAAEAHYGLSWHSLTSNLCPIRLCRRRCDSRDVKVREGRGLTAQIKPSWKLWKLFSPLDHTSISSSYFWVWQRFVLTSRCEAYECLTEVMKKHGAADRCFLDLNVPWITLNWTQGTACSKTFYVMKQHSRVWSLRQRSGKCCYETQAVMRLSVWSNFYSRLSLHNLSIQNTLATA